MGKAQQHLVMPVKTGIQEGMDSCPLDLAFARMTRIRGYDYEMGHLVLKESKT